MTPAEVAIANEDLIRALGASASAEVLDQHLGDDVASLKQRYLCLCQMLALFTTLSQRKDWNIRFIDIQAKAHGVDFSKE
jgi:hypothetical protein